MKKYFGMICFAMSLIILITTAHAQQKITPGEGGRTFIDIDTVPEEWLNKVEIASKIYNFTKENEISISQIPPLYVKAYANWTNSSYPTLAKDFNKTYLLKKRSGRNWVIIYYIKNDGFVFYSFSEKVSNEELEGLVRNASNMTRKGYTDEELIAHIGKGIASLSTPKQPKKKKVGGLFLFTGEESPIQLEKVEIEPEVKPGENLSIKVKLNESILEYLKSLMGLSMKDRWDEYKTQMEKTHKQWIKELKKPPVKIRAQFVDEYGKIVEEVELKDFGEDKDGKLGDLLFGFNDEVKIPNGVYGINIYVWLRKGGNYFKGLEKYERTFERVGSLEMLNSKPYWTTLFFKKDYKKLDTITYLQLKLRGLGKDNNTDGKSRIC